MRRGFEILSLFFFFPVPAVEETEEMKKVNRDALRNLQEFTEQDHDAGHARAAEEMARLLGM